MLFGLIELIDHLGFLIYLRSYSSLCPKGLETAVRETDYSNKISQNKTIALAYLLVNISRVFITSMPWIWTQGICIESRNNFHFMTKETMQIPP